MSTDNENSIQSHSDVSTNDGSLLQAKGVKKHFSTNTGLIEQLIGGEEYVKAVDGVNLTIGEHETLGLVGESGCGKSTLGRTLSRLYEPTDGTIHFDGTDIAEVSGSDLKQLRKRVQVIFQDPLSSLNPRKTAGEIVEKPLEVHDIAGGNDRRERVAELFQEVGLQESHMDRYPHEFSGGQRQRIGIARALAVEPDLIIADEPVSALDVSVQAQIINLMKRLQDEYGLSYLFIAHDLSVVKHISDRVAVMYLGQIVEKGSTEAIFKHPQHPYTRALLRSIPSVEGEQGRRENVLQGNPPSPVDAPAGCPFHTRCPEHLGDECTSTKPNLQSIAEADGTIRAPDNVPYETDENVSNNEGHVAACHWLDYDPDDRHENDPLTEKATKDER